MMASVSRGPQGSVVYEMKQDAKEIAQELTTSARAAARDGARYVQERLHDGLHQADGLMVEYTGRSASRWRSDLKAHVRQSPLSSFAIMVAAGFVIGKLLQARGTDESSRRAHAQRRGSAHPKA
jgi:ElaB/YqjD/DUF883 family membrane-anchored ribosome-binding protein